jgi:hypothetical protein
MVTELAAVAALRPVPFIQGAALTGVKVHSQDKVVRAAGAGVKVEVGALHGGKGVH